MRLLQNLVTIYILFYQFWTIVVQYGTNIINGTSIFTNLIWFNIKLSTLFWISHGEEQLVTVSLTCWKLTMAIIAKMQRKCLSYNLLLFKLTNNILLVPRAYISCSYMPLPSPLTITGAQHNLNYIHMQTASRIYQCSFFLRTIPQWNNLRIPDLDNLTMNQFKSKLLI